MNKRDYYYWEAKRRGYKSRASLKLIQIDDRFYLLKSGYHVLDLGASPGGWIQVVLERTGSNGHVVAIDIAPLRIRDPRVKFLRMDVLNHEVFEGLKEYVPFDVVLSDMAPKLSGVSSWDHGRSMELAERALEIAMHTLRTGGHFLVKIFRGDMEKNYVKKCKQYFDMVKVHKPKASSPKSAEIYVICKRFKLESTP